MPASLAELERIVADALTSTDPCAALLAAQSDNALLPETREALAAVDTDGFSIASLLIVRLRFERLIQGSALASGWFARDPATFAAAFKQYHTHVDPTHLMPAEEAYAFENWFAETGDST